MTREFLEELQLEPQVAEAIWDAHAAAVQRLEFGHALDAAITKAGGRNATAIKSLLDLDALQAAPDTLETAIGQLKQENGYLFLTPRPPVYARATGTDPQPTQQPMTLAAALKERFERK